MKTFKFGQLLPKEDICDREEEITILSKICKMNGRAVVYGPRRYGKTSVIKNVVMANFLKQRDSLALCADLFQVDSMEDMVLRLQVAFEQALSHQAKITSFVKNIYNYLKHFRVEMTVDPLSGTPTVTFAGAHARDEKTLGEIFVGIKQFSEEYRTLLVLDEFQDIKNVDGLEAQLRSEIQNLDKTAVILLGSKKHILRDMFLDASKPFYGFGVDVTFGNIPREAWVLYMQERFAPAQFTIEKDGVFEICKLMRDVPNSIQELCQWIVLQEGSGPLTSERIHMSLKNLIDNKLSRYLERLGTLSLKEKKVLIAVANEEPVSSVSSTRFLQATDGVSATATKATIFRLADHGMLDSSEDGYWITDPIFRLFLVRQFGGH